MTRGHAHLLALAATLLLTGAGIWRGFFVEPRDLRVEHPTICLPSFSGKGRPVRLALLADLHAAHWEEERVSRAVQAIKEEKPDAVFLLGDYRYALNNQVSMEPSHVARLLSPLAEQAPVFYVTGNHDDDAADPEKQAWGHQLRQCFKAAGFICLENQTVRLALNEQCQLDFHGLPYVRPNTGAQTALCYRSLRSPGIPLIAIAHDPYDFLKYPVDCDAMLGAHTHGGQICLPGGKPIFASGDRPPHFQQAGLRTGATGQPIYTTRGLGVSKLPLRLNCPPEVTILTIR